MGISTEKVKILLVDDKLSNLTTLEAVLSGPDYELISVQSGFEAVQRAQQVEFAVILLDVQMPGKDGFQTAVDIRSHGASKGAPIIFVTAIYGDEAYVNIGYEVGAVDYIFKPFNPNVLSSKVSFFVELFKKSKMLLEQSERLRELEQREQRRQLAEVRIQNFQRETALREKYKDLVSSMDHCIIWSADPEAMQFSFVSEQAESLTGYTTEEWQRSRGFLVQHIHHEDLPLMMNALKNIYAQPNQTVEHRFVTHSGESIWLQTRLRLVNSGDANAVELRGLSVNITPLKNAEHILSQAEETQRFLSQLGMEFSAASLSFQKTLEKMAQLVATKYNACCAIHTVDDASDFMIPKVAATAQGSAKLLSQLLINEENFPAIFPFVTSEHAGIGAALKTKTSTMIPEVVATGFSSVLSYMCVPIMSREHLFGAMTLINPQRPFEKKDVEIMEEVARRAALSLENALLYKKAENAINIRDQFLSIASHELKTPLTPLKIQFQMLARLIGDGRLDSVGPEKLMSMLRRNDRQLDRLSGLIDDLLNVAQINLGRVKLNFKQTDLGIIIRDVAEQFKDELANSGSQIHLDISSNLTGEWDQFKLEQVLINLIGNSIKYGGGRPIDVSAGDVEGMIRVSVRDHGIGIDTKDQARVFELFERAVPSQNYGGLGLGLYIVQNIIRQHQGRIWVDSQLGKGSCFTFELPRHRPHEDASTFLKKEKLPRNLSAAH